MTGSELHRSREPGVAAVLFDMDGLLVDSEPLWTVAEEELAAELGGTWTREIKAAVVGTRLDVSVPTMLRMLGADADVGWATDFLLARMVDLFGTRLPLKAGAVELLDDLGRTGVPLALVSSSYRVLVDAALAALGDDRFAVTVAGDEVLNGKPDPEPYLTAARALGVDPARCGVFEDAPAGVASAEAAGALCVAVPEVAQIAASPTRPVLRSLADVDAAWVLALR